METKIENENKKSFSVRQLNLVNESVKTAKYSVSLGSQLNSIDLGESREESYRKIKLLITLSAYFKKHYGLFLAILSTLCITCSLFLVKISIVLNACDMAVITFAVQLIFCVPFGYFFKQNLIGPQETRCLLLSRALTGVTSVIACYFSVKLINLADAISIKSIAFIITTIMAYIFLKERFTFIYFIAFSFSLIGVVCIVRPMFLFKYISRAWEYESNVSTIIGLSFALISSFTLSSTFIFVKKLTIKNVHFSVIVFYFCLVGLVISLIASIVFFSTGFTHESWDLGKQFLFRDISLGVLSGCLIMIGHICFTSAISSESANMVAMFRTCDILIAYLLEFFILRIKPELLSLIGSTLILVGVTTIFIYKIMILRNVQRSSNLENNLFRI